MHKSTPLSIQDLCLHGRVSRPHQQEILFLIGKITQAPKLVVATSCAFQLSYALFSSPPTTIFRDSTWKPLHALHLEAQTNSVQGHY